MNETKKRSRFKVLPTGDPKTAFQRMTAQEILAAYGPPQRLLGSSKKAQKCERVRVLNQVLYLTPGVFCPAATDGCLRGCLGHTSGTMQLPSSTLARDRRAALYLEDQDLFLTMLQVELHQLARFAEWRELIPAARLNGTGDIPWERLHPELLAKFENVQFFDYTKLTRRMRDYLQGSTGNREWPQNYHLTFSADEKNRDEAERLLALGANVAVVFWPELPQRWWGYAVIDGEQHDARFLDPDGVVVGLKAKGIARVDLSGFVVRTCPRCQSKAPELTLISIAEDSHRKTVHQCTACGFELRSRWILPHALKQPAGNFPRIGSPNRDAA